jgi:hypothetical protein
MKRYVVEFKNGDYLLLRNGFNGVKIEDATHFKLKRDAMDFVRAVGKNGSIHLLNKNNLKVGVCKIHTINVEIIVSFID